MDPCIVITNSCGTINPECVIKKILESEELPEPLVILPEVKGYSWHIDTKYYHADVNLCSLDHKSIGTEEFAESVNALILPFDSNCINGLKSAEQWLVFTEEWEAEIKILLCNNCRIDEPSPEHPEQISKIEAQNWCVKNGFELVELDPIVEEDSDVEDDFPESTGIKRVIQALQAHIWPNLIMKDEASRSPFAGLQHVLNGLPTDNPTPATTEKKVNGDTTNSRKKLIAEVKPLPKESMKPSNIAIVSSLVSPMSYLAEAIENIPSTSTENGHSNNYNPPESEASSTKLSSTRDERIDSMLQAMDAMPEESFEELFHSLNEMKSKAESISPSQRKVYAEKMAVAFWKSIGGHESEVDGISSDED